jgi:hypothetical protein
MFDLAARGRSGEVLPVGEVADLALRYATAPGDQ